MTTDEYRFDSKHSSSAIFGACCRNIQAAGFSKAYVLLGMTIKKHTVEVSAKFVFFMWHHCHRASSIRILFAAAAAACCFWWLRRCYCLCLATVVMFRCICFAAKRLYSPFTYSYIYISSKTTHLNVHKSDIFSNLSFYLDLQRNKQSTREKRRETIDNENKNGDNWVALATRKSNFRTCFSIGFFSLIFLCAVSYHHRNTLSSMLSRLNSTVLYMFRCCLFRRFSVHLIFQ